jgi:uracil-DNA glycosylase family 4
MADCSSCKCAVVPDSLPVAPRVRREGLLALVTDAPSGAEALGRDAFQGAAGEVMAGTIRAVRAYAGYAGASDLSPDLFESVAVFHAVARPTPGGKPPRIADVRACRARLLDELDQARPRAVLSAGASACASLAGTGKATPITQWRGQMRWLDLPSGRVPWVATISPGSVVARPDLYRDFSFDVYKVWTQREPMAQAVIYEVRDLEELS